MNPDLDKILTVARRAAKNAAEAIQSARAGADFSLNHKSTRDLVTSADLLAEKIIVAEILKHFPDHHLLTEEQYSTIAESQFAGPVWIIDPIDGTTNFVHGHAHVGVSIGFANHGQIQVGVINAPFLGEEYWGIRGQGSFLNGKRISCSHPKDVSDCLISTGFPYDFSDPEVIETICRQFRNILPICRDMRRAGAASIDLAWVASGRLDGFYESLQPWDLAAGILIAEEAGARVGNFIDPQNKLPQYMNGKNLLVTAPELFEDLKELLNR